tara:strand:- start:3910 stop:4365 length:456 start_codon:yes stop_codon:yes gene_type:complete
MSSFTITGKDTLTLFGRIYNDFADGDNLTITFPNELKTVKTGKNNNSIYADNSTGKNADMSIRVLRGSSDDRFLQGKLIEQNNQGASFTTAEGEFVKILGDGQGNTVSDIYTLQGGIFTKEVDGKENVEGDTEQAVSVYNLKFARASRSIG